MSTLRATKNAIERHEAKYGRNIALRRAFNLTGGATPNIGILKNDKLVFGGTFTAAHKWLKNGQKKVDVSQWEVAPVEELGKLCENKHTAQCNKLARAMPKGLKLRVVMKKKATEKKVKWTGPPSVYGGPSDHAKNLRDCRPTVMVEFSNPSKTKKKIKRRVLLDTGAIRSAILKQDAEELQLQTAGEKKFNCGNGVCTRKLTQVHAKVNGKRYTLNPSIRDKDNNTHSLLGIDWIFQSNIDLNKRPTKCDKMKP